MQVGRLTLEILQEKISRRDFLKKAGVAAVTVGAGLYLADRLFFTDSSPDALEGSVKQGSEAELGKWSRKALFFDEMGGRVRCRLCPNHCNLKEGEGGICRTRINHGGILYTLTYGNPVSVHTDPIEKKPFYHFLPGSKAFSISTEGCNLRCLYCQNWEISQSEPGSLRHYDLPPEKLVEALGQVAARDSGVKSIAYTYGEPTAYYDYMIDSARIIREEGFRNTVVTSGYINREPLQDLCRVVDAIKIDLKGFNEDFYRRVCSAELSKVLESIKTIRESGTWLEIVNLVVPTLNDDMDEIREMAEWIVENVGVDVPIHYSRFSPRYKLKNLPPTPLETMKKAWETGRKAGLNYVYIGNVPHGRWENTYCPGCGSLAVERRGYSVSLSGVDNRGYCSKCGEFISGVWE